MNKFLCKLINWPVAKIILCEPSKALYPPSLSEAATSMNIHDRRSEDLWQEAAETLSDGDLKHINIDTNDRITVLADVLKIVTGKQEACDRKRWKYKKNNGEEVIIRDILAKITRHISHFRDMGDKLVQYDPQHAALPWAAIRLILQVRDPELYTYPEVIVSAGWRSAQSNCESTLHSLSPGIDRGTRLL